MVRLEADLFPSIGKNPIRDLNAPALLEVLQAVEGRSIPPAEHQRMFISENAGGIGRTKGADIHGLHWLTIIFPNSPFSIQATQRQCGIRLRAQATA